MRTRSPLESMKDTAATSTVTSPGGKSAIAVAKSGAVCASISPLSFHPVVVEEISS
jgi:hypothetical protein